MKIGIVCYPTFGGSGVLATELGQGLARRGHQVHFITYRQPVRLLNFTENVYYHEVPTADYPLFEYPPYDTAMTSTLVDVALTAGLDILHVHYAIPHAAIAYMAREILKTHGRHVPFVTTLHGTDITLVGKNRAFAPVVAFSINQSDGVTAVSESLRQDTLDAFKVEVPIEVIYNFVDSLFGIQYFLLVNILYFYVHKSIALILVFPHIFNPKTQNILIPNSICNYVFMQAIAK